MLRTLRDYIESCIIFNVNFMANSLCSAENVPLQLDCFFALRYMELAEDSIWLCATRILLQLLPSLRILFGCFAVPLSACHLCFLFKYLLTPCLSALKSRNRGTQYRHGKISSILFNKSQIIMSKNITRHLGIIAVKYTGNLINGFWIKAIVRLSFKFSRRENANN